MGRASVLPIPPALRSWRRNIVAVPRFELNSLKRTDGPKQEGDHCLISRVFFFFFSVGRCFFLQLLRRADWTPPSPPGGHSAGLTSRYSCITLMGKRARGSRERRERLLPAPQSSNQNRVVRETFASFLSLALSLSLNRSLSKSLSRSLSSFFFFSSLPPPKKRASRSLLQFLLSSNPFSNGPRIPPRAPQLVFRRRARPRSQGDVPDERRRPSSAEKQCVRVLCRRGDKHGIFQVR